MMTNGYNNNIMDFFLAEIRGDTDLDLINFASLVENHVMIQ